MWRATGLDIGTTQSRTVSVGVLWGGPRVESETPSNGSIIANVGADKLTFRSFNVPPHAGREMQGGVIREELAYSLPFSLDLATWDWITNDDMASVMVAFNEDILSIRHRLGDNVILDAEPLSLLRACLESGHDEALIFDFGATHTTICAIKDRALDWVKVSFHGGQDLSKRISEANDCGEIESEAIKCSIGCEDSTCQQWLDEIIDNAVLTLPLPFNKVFICGGGAAMPGLREQLQQRLDQSVETFPLPEPLNPYTDVMAYGAALAGKARRPHIQLCPVTPKSDKIKIVYAIWVAILLAMGTLDLELRHATAQRLQEQHQTVIANAIQEQAPELANVDKDKLAEEVEKRLADFQRISVSSPHNVAMTLANLAKPLNNMSDVEIRTIELKPDNSGQQILVDLTGLAGSGQMVEEFRSASDKVLTKAELISNRAGSGNTTRFSIEGQLRQQ